MKIILNNEYRIEDIPLGFVLKRTTITYGNADNKTTEPKMVTKDVAYYTQVSAAVEKFIRLMVDDETSDYEGDLEGYVKRVENIIADCQKQKINVVEAALKAKGE